MDELRQQLQEIAARLPELQRLVEEAAGYAILPPGVIEAKEHFTRIARVFNDASSDMRRFLLSQFEGGSEPPPPWTRNQPWPEPPPESGGGAGMGARRPTPPLPRAPGGERQPDDAREPARNP